MRVIYADILIAINLAIDYLLLFAAARIGGLKFERIKGLLAAAAGAIYSLIILFDLPQLVFIISKLIVSCFMLRVSFGKRKLNDFFRILMIFYICGFLFSGFMMLINQFVHADSFFVKGGIVYFEFSPMGIVLSGTSAFLLTEILRRLFHHGEPEGCSIITVYYHGKRTVLKGLVDTGNSLEEPFSGTPVAVFSYESAAKILTEEMISALHKNDLSTKYGIRFIPAKTVSGSVLMPAFRPDKMTVKNESGEFEAEDVMIAVSENAPENTIIIGKNIILREKDRIFSEV